MTALIAILSSVLISSTVFASGGDCLQKLDSMLYRKGESSRLNAVAIAKGFDIETGEVHAIGNTSKKHVLAYIDISNREAEIVEKMRTEFIQNCLK